MATKEEVLKGIESVENLLSEMVSLGKDAIRFVVSRGLWEDFMKFHTEELLKRTPPRSR